MAVWCWLFDPLLDDWKTSFPERQENWKLFRFSPGMWTFISENQKLSLVRCFWSAEKYKPARHSWGACWSQSQCSAFGSYSYRGSRRSAPDTSYSIYAHNVPLSRSPIWLDLCLTASFNSVNYRSLTCATTDNFFNQLFSITPIPTWL